MNMSRSSGIITHVPSAQLRSKLQHEVRSIDTDCRALVYSRTPQRMGAPRSACRGAPLAFGVGQPLSAEWAHDGPHAVPAACMITDYSTSTSLWQLRIELTTLGLWDLRAASCATATMKVSRSSSVMTQVPNAQLRSKLQDEVLASDTDCRALWYSRTPQRMGAPRSACRGAPLAFWSGATLICRVGP